MGKQKGTYSKSLIILDFRSLNRVFGFAQGDIGGAAMNMCHQAMDLGLDTCMIGVFDPQKMKSDIEKYGLYTYEDFADYMTYEQFVALGLANFKVSVGTKYESEGVFKAFFICGVSQSYEKPAVISNKCFIKMGFSAFLIPLSV